MSFSKQRITVLGSTGSIGVNTLDVIAHHPERFEVFALSAATQTDLMLAQCVQFKPRYAVMASEPHARQLADQVKAHQLPVQVLWAPDALEMIASHESVDTVMAWDLPERQKRKLFWDNALRFYRRFTPAAIPAPARA